MVNLKPVLYLLLFLPFFPSETAALTATPGVKCINIDGQIECHAVAANRMAYKTIGRFANGAYSWSPWQDFSGTAGPIFDTIPDCVSMKSAHMECFIEHANILHHRWRVPGHDFVETWYGIAPKDLASNSDVDCVATRPNHQGESDKIVCIGRNSQGGFSKTTFDWANSWSLATQHALPVAQAKGTPSCTSWADSSYDCFARTTNNELWKLDHVTQGFNTKMNGLHDTDPECVAPRNGVHFCASLGPDRTTKLNIFAGGFSHEITVPGSENSGTKPACIAQDLYTVNCRVVKRNGSIHQFSWHLPMDKTCRGFDCGTLSNMTRLLPRAAMPIKTSPFCVTSLHNANEPICFYVGYDNAVYSDYGRSLNKLPPLPYPITVPHQDMWDLPRFIYEYMPPLMNYLPDNVKPNVGGILANYVNLGDFSIFIDKLPGKHHQYQYENVEEEEILAEMHGVFNVKGTFNRNNITGSAFQKVANGALDVLEKFAGYQAYKPFEFKVVRQNNSKGETQVSYNHKKKNPGVVEATETKMTAILDMEATDIWTEFKKEGNGYRFRNDHISVGTEDFGPGRFLPAIEDLVPVNGFFGDPGNFQFKFQKSNLEITSKAGSIGQSNSLRLYTGADKKSYVFLPPQRNWMNSKVSIMINDAKKVILGMEIFGACPFNETPNKHTSPDQCDLGWNVLDKNFIYVDRVDGKLADLSMTFLGKVPTGATISFKSGFITMPIPGQAGSIRANLRDIDIIIRADGDSTIAGYVELFGYTFRIDHTTPQSINFRHDGENSIVTASMMETQIAPGLVGSVYAKIKKRNGFNSIPESGSASLFFTGKFCMLGTTGQHPIFRKNEFDLHQALQSAQISGYGGLCPSNVAGKVLNIPRDVSDQFNSAVYAFQGLTGEDAKKAVETALKQYIDYSKLIQPDLGGVVDVLKGITDIFWPFNTGIFGRTADASRIDDLIDVPCTLANYSCIDVGERAIEIEANGQGRLCIRVDQFAKRVICHDIPIDGYFDNPPGIFPHIVGPSPLPIPDIK